jgi:hypothetical protein
LAAKVAKRAARPHLTRLRENTRAKPSTSAMNSPGLGNKIQYFQQRFSLTNIDKHV